MPSNLRQGFARDQLAADDEACDESNDVVVVVTVAVAGVFCKKSYMLP